MFQFMWISGDVDGDAVRTGGVGCGQETESGNSDVQGCGSGLKRGGDTAVRVMLQQRSPPCPPGLDGTAGV